MVNTGSPDRPVFDLTTEPWIPVALLNGENTDWSLTDVLVRAHQVRGLNEPSPLTTAAMARLLLAVLHRSYEGPKTVDEWDAIWLAGRFDAAQVEKYLTYWRSRSRFDLFDPMRPFFQVPAGPHLGKHHPISLLLAERASGNNVTLFDHSRDDQPLPMTSGEACRALITRQAYSIGFGKSSPFYFKDSPLVRGYCILLDGETLFQTLALNLQLYGRNLPHDLPWPSGEDDAPCWEWDDVPPPDERGTDPRGLTDLLTWQSRQIALLPEPDGRTVRWCQLQQRYVLKQGIFDPFKRYGKTAEGLPVPRGFLPGRALWRDSHALILRKADQGERPAIFDWMVTLSNHLTSHGHAPPPFVFRACGLTTAEGKAASVILWRMEQMSLAVSLLQQPRLSEEVGAALEGAMHGRRALGAAARVFARTMLAPKHPKDKTDKREPKPEDVTRMVASLGLDERYWPHLERPFQQFLDQLAAIAPDGMDDDSDAVGVIWKTAIVQAARTAFDQSIRLSGGNARHIFPWVRGDDALRGNLRKYGLLETERVEFGVQEVLELEEVLP